MMKRARSFAVVLGCAWLLSGVALAYPGGTPDFQTNVAPYCAACHASADLTALEGVAGERPALEVADRKHLASIAAGSKNYAGLSQADRARLVEMIRAVDANSKVEIEFPPQVAPGETFQVTVRLSGGAGPVVGTGLIDRPHRWFAKSAETAGWKVVGAPTVIGNKGQPQNNWLARRPERQGHDITYVDVNGWKSDAATGKWAKGKVIWTLRAPDEPGDYPLVAFYLYGTETATPIATKVDPNYGDQPLGGYAGKSGRVKFTPSQVISVK